MASASGSRRMVGTPIPIDVKSKLNIEQQTLLESPGSLERQLIEQGFLNVCGTDEAGRGPLAGPVVAAAVIYTDVPAIHGAQDSKRLSIREREAGYKELITSVQFAVGLCSAEEIDVLNILQASLTAMSRAVQNLTVTPDFVLADGNRVPLTSIPARAIVRGDSRVRVISAASILAKVTRDLLMRQMDALYPGYGFATHFGYPTARHSKALRELGPCPIHRKTFRGVRELLEPAAAP